MPNPQQPTIPAGRVRLQQLHGLLVREYGDVPTDYTTFEEKFLADPVRQQKLYDKLKADQFEDLPADFATFEGAVTEGLKKKDAASAPSPTAAGSPGADGAASANPLAPAALADFPTAANA
ncbi:hypothetical protein, partial [Hymenobacter glacieicola]|uniref:hypothetical protein n=1 Tax=Hymenobacter glacieicola TaxID=1562124 RepID=UPI001E605845